MNRYNIEAAVITHIGADKDINEDNYYVNGSYKMDSQEGTCGIADKKKRNSYTYAVCDGMGGESYGELDSLLAAATLEKYKKTDIRQSVNRYIVSANEFICDLLRNGGVKKSRTTLSLLNLQNNTAVAYNVGDSRVYFCRKGNLYLLSTDDVDESIQSEDKLTQYLGMHPSEKSIVANVSKTTTVKKGDVFLLCSSGLTKVVSDSEIVELLSSEADNATTMTKKLVSLAQENYGKEDVTVLVVKIA